MPRKPKPYKPPPLETHPYYRIHDWKDHQPPEARNGAARFIRNWCSLLQNPKYFILTAAERGVLHGLWLYQGGTGLRPPRDPFKVRSSLSLGRNKYLSRHLETLERRGFLVPARTQRRGEEKRTPLSPPKGGRSASRDSRNRSRKQSTEEKTEYQPTEDEIQAELKRMGYEPKGGQTCPTKDSDD